MQFRPPKLGPHHQLVILPIYRLAITLPHHKFSGECGFAKKPSHIPTRLARDDLGIYMFRGKGPRSAPPGMRHHNGQGQITFIGRNYPYHIKYKPQSLRIPLWRRIFITMWRGIQVPCLPAPPNTEEAGLPLGRGCCTRQSVFKMAWKIGILVALAGGLVAAQDCTSSGVDIQSGGTYYINPASSAQFSFTSTFAGCTSSDSVAPTLQAPGGETYTCSNVPLSTSDEVSTWYVLPRCR
jgi:hypothetical protein